MKKLYGITTAMITPFNDNGSVNYDAVAELTEFLVKKGVHCLYPLGTTGEMFRLTEAERKQVAETVIQTNKGRATVYIHVGAMTQDETVALARHALEAGADGIGVVTPTFFGANDRELENYYISIASAVPHDFPVYLYNIPQCSGNNLSAEVAQRVADQCQNVVGIKYSYHDCLVANNYLAIRDYNFSVVFGACRLFLPALAMGCDGIVSGITCVYPEPYLKVYEAFKKGDLIAAQKAQRLAIKFSEILRNGSNMSYLKEGLKYRGVSGGIMRAPQMDLPETEILLLREALNQLEKEAQF